MTMPKTYYMLVDCESTNKRYCLDLGFYILDSKGAINFKKHIVVAEIARFPLFSNKHNPDYQSRNQFYKKLEMLQSNHYDKMKIREINRLFNYINNRFNPIFCAYSISADLGFLQKTGIETDIFKRRFCLLRHAKKVLGNSPSYARFCLENGFLTPTGKLSFTAQTVGRYIYNNPKFIERHTSYHDLVLERDIFIYLQRQKKAKDIKMID